MRINQRGKTENINFSNKLEFIVGFFAIIFALTSFKDKLELIKLDILIGSFSLFSLISFFLGLLFVSIYLYALNYIRYDFPALLKIKWLSWLGYIEFLARLAYFITIIIFPLFLLITCCISSVIKVLPAIPSNFKTLLSEITGVVVALVFVLVSFIMQLLRFREEKSALMEKLKEKERRFSLKAKNLYEKGSYDFFLLNIYNSLTKLIGSRLVEKYGLDIGRISSKALIDLAEKNKLISKNDLAFINDLRILRNQVAHGTLTEKISKNKVEFFMNRINEIIDKLD